MMTIRQTAFLALLFSTGLLFAQDQPGSKPSAKKTPWTVNAKHGDEKTISFDTQEGTWMSVDVSPDGRSIAFDMLGDIYTMPLAGGQAKALTTGRAYDSQPRFSPDGKSLLFTSDRGGTDNLWIISLDGKKTRPLTSQRDKVTNSGDWSPDGRHVVARRRLTDRSSIGTVELWLVDVNGGSGIQLTKKKQFGDANGPVFGPQGKALYFAGRKGRFEYNRNTDTGFWQLYRFDLESGELRRLSRSGGGSARPRVAPDGKHLAFVRRIRGKSCLFLYDLESGAETLVTDSLDPDMQEAFAWTGAYPGYDWLPNSQEIVYSAGGKLWRWKLAKKSRIEIPFTVKVKRQAAVPIRVKQELDSDIDIKVLRWMQKNPVHNQILFGALGHLYNKDLKTNKIARLTTDKSHLEYSPSLSPDGQSVVYVAWSDSQKGQILTCSSKGGKGTALTKKPGNYFRPAFSPDGQSIVFIRGSNAYLRTATLTGEDWLELCTMSLKTKVIKKVKTIERICSPRFSPDGKRIFYIENDKDNYSKLCSVTRLGQERREHLKIKFLGEAMVSRDGRYLAYQQRYQVYVNAIPLVSHQIVEAGPQLPHFKMTDIGGDWPNWVSSDEVSCSLGQNFMTLSMKAALAKNQSKAKGDSKRDGAEKSPAMPIKTETVAMRVGRDKPKGKIAYVHGTLITMDGENIIQNGTILVANNRILDLGPCHKVKVPDDAKVIDISGHTVIPGYIDVHAHMHWGYRDVLPEQDHSYFANLAYGVTTVHDPSAFSQTVFGQGERVATGRTVGPRVFSTGTILYGADSIWTAKINSEADARKHIQRLKSYGAISVKSYMQPRRSQRQMILKAARKEKMMVFPEGGGNFEMNLGMVFDGHSGIEHTLPIAPLYKDVIQSLAQSKVGITPTMLVSYGGLSGERWFYKHYDVWKNTKLLRFTPRDWIDQRSRRREVSPEEDYHHKRIAVSLKNIVEAGGRIQLGSHGQLQGLGAHWELWAIAQGGMKAMDVLRCGTVFSAEYIGVDHELGRLKKNYLADFQILKKNPLDDIKNTDSIAYVVVNGRLYNAETMAQVWPKKRACPQFYWQNN